MRRTQRGSKEMSLSEQSLQADLCKESSQKRGEPARLHHVIKSIGDVVHGRTDDIGGG